MQEAHYDIVICGGGVAGVAAALSAAARGHRTALIEKTLLPGGLATSGLVLVYLPLCDGMGHQVISGLAEKFLLASNQYGPIDVPEWNKEVRYKVYFSPASFVLALDGMLQKSGVVPWLDTRLIDTEVQNGRVTAAIVANKSGIIRIRAHCFVDATGDADLIHFGGGSCHVSSNSMVCWSLEHRDNLHNRTHIFGKECTAEIMADPLEKTYTNEEISGKLVTDFVLEGRNRYRQQLDQDYASGKSNRKTRYPLSLQTIPPIRKTRAIKGRFTLRSGMQWKEFEDSVGLVGDWRKRGDVWEIPYGSLVPDTLLGVLAAGRCISSINDAWEVTRVIPVSALTGELAGIAAALSFERKILPHELPYECISSELRRRYGFRLRFEDIS